MGFFDRLFGREDSQSYQNQPPPAPGRHADSRSQDEIAVDRYQYLLRTAPPETIEQVHAEAFGKLTPEQRHLLFQQLSQNPNPRERPADDSPSTLARSATRAEMQQPGTLARTFGGQGQGAGPSFGSMVGSSLLGTVAGYVIGSALVSAFMPMDGGGDSSADGGDGSGDGSGDGGSEGSGDGGEAGGDYGADTGGGDYGGGDYAGGDFGGGDFGGGDFGGGF